MKVKFSFVVIIVIIFSANLTAQDSISVMKRISELEARLDSLQKLISGDSISYPSYQEVYGTPQEKDTTDITEKDLLKELTSIFSFDETIQTSKRKRIDQLLKALRSRPGVLNFNGDLTSVTHWKGGKDSFFNSAASFDFFAFAQFGEGAQVFIDLEGVGGQEPTKNYNTFSNLNADVGSKSNINSIGGIHVLEAWAEFSFLENWFTITAGKIDLTNYFDLNTYANDETSQFISEPFVNSAALPVPANTPGIRLNAELFNIISFQVAGVKEISSGYKIFSNLFTMMSTGILTDFGDEYTGSLNVYGYFDGINAEANGIGVSIDQSLGEHLGVFGRWNENNNEYRQFFPVRRYWSLGVSANYILMDKPFANGLAVGEINPYDNTIESETLLELYWQCYFNDWIHISPHLQYIWNAGGSKENYLFTGLRTQFNF